MAKYRDPGENLHWIEEALLDEEDEQEEYETWDEEEDADVLSPSYFRAQRAAASRQEFDENAAVRPRQNRKVGKLLLLLLFEIAAIAAIVRWWITWW